MAERLLSQDVLDALHWCRLGRIYPDDDAAFHEAKDLGLLAQDPVWRTTVAGEVALARARPVQYGARPMALACPHCGAPPYEPCRGRLPGRIQLYHARRDNRALS